MAEAERALLQPDQRAMVGAVHREPGIEPTERPATAEAALGSVERAAARIHRRPTAKRPPIRELESLAHRR